MCEIYCVSSRRKIFSEIQSYFHKFMLPPITIDMQPKNCHERACRLAIEATLNTYISRRAVVGGLQQGIDLRRSANSSSVLSHSQAMPPKPLPHDGSKSLVSLTMEVRGRALRVEHNKVVLVVVPPRARPLDEGKELIERKEWVVRKSANRVVEIVTVWRCEQ